MEYTLSGGSRCRRGSPQGEDPCIFSDFPSRKVKNGNAKEAADRAVARWLSREYQRIQQGQVGKMSKGDGSSSWGARRDRERPQQREGGQPGCARDLAPQTRPAGQSPSVKVGLMQGVLVHREDGPSPAPAYLPSLTSGAWPSSVTTCGRGGRRCRSPSASLILQLHHRLHRLRRQ